MADTRRKTIPLLGEVITKFKTSTAAAITPGDLIEVVSGGTVRRHATAGGNAVKMFAMEDEGQGKTIDDNYANSSQIRCIIPERGAEILCSLANGESVVAGDFVESAGGGKLRKHDPILNANSSSDTAVIYPECIIGRAAEACDMSDSSAADPSGRFAVEII